MVVHTHTHIRNNLSSQFRKPKPLQGHSILVYISNFTSYCILNLIFFILAKILFSFGSCYATRLHVFALYTHWNDKHPAQSMHMATAERKEKKKKEKKMPYENGSSIRQVLKRNYWLANLLFSSLISVSWHGIPWQRLINTHTYAASSIDIIFFYQLVPCVCVGVEMVNRNRRYRNLRHRPGNTGESIRQHVHTSTQRTTQYNVQL